LLLTLAQTTQPDTLNQVYSEAFEEFNKKLRAPDGLTAKDRRESTKEKSDYIKQNFKPEADVLKTPDNKWSDFFQESKSKAKERLREHLGDTVSEFVDTNVLTGNEFFEVLLEVVYDNWQYYQKNANENQALLKLLQNVKND
jgi:hypothetical protein